MEQTPKKVLFKEGDEVAHKENIETKLEVRRVIRTKKKARNATEQERVFTLGIECGWWVEKEYKVQIFHTNSLVPWDVAQEGFVSVIRYLERKQNIGA